MFKRKVLSVFFGTLMIIVGVYCFFTPVETSAVIPLVLGIVMIADGIGRIATWFDIRDIVRQILALGIIRIVHAFHLLKLKKESDGFGFSEMLGSNWWIALILGALLTISGVIVILNPMLGLGVIGVLVGCSVITAGINLIFLACSPWIL